MFKGYHLEESVSSAKKGEEHSNMRKADKGNLVSYLTPGSTDRSMRRSKEPLRATLLWRREVKVLWGIA